MSKYAKRYEEWVLNIVDKHNQPFPGIPPKSLQASTDSEEKPSIFCSDHPSLVYFDDDCYLNYQFESQRKNCKGWQFVAFMRRWFDLDVCSYLEYIQDKEHLARGYYQGGGYYGRSDTEKKLFREYLLINSCILVFAILLFQNVLNGIDILNGTKKESREAKEQMSIEFYLLYHYIMKDPMKIKLQMLAMRYQMPWFVVECMYTNHSNLSKLIVGTTINKLALSCFDDLYPRVHESKVHGGTSTLPPGGFKHLLHMFHWSRTPEGMFLAETRSLLSIKKMGDFYIPSATNLQLSETVFQKHASGSIDMSYHDRRLSGEMHLTPWHLLQYSTELYEELLTFERHYVDCGLPFMTYVACMACLLNTEEDVRVLRASGIIQSMRFDNNDVLARVVKLKTMVADYVSMPNELVILEEKVMEHDQRSSSRVYGEFKRRYCSNPWVIVSVIGGILLFVYTFIQTLYGALSYYKKGLH